MKNKLLPLAALVALLTDPVSALAEAVDKDRITVINNIASDATFRPHQSGFPDPIRANLVANINNSLDLGRDVTLFGEEHEWQRLSKIKSLTEPGIQVLRMELSTDRFTKGKLKLSGVEKATVYLDGDKQSGEGEYSLTLYNGEHRILIVTEQVDNWKEVAVDWTSDDEAHQVTFHKKAPKHRLNARQMYDSQTVSGLNMSPDGRQFVWTKTHYSQSTGDKATRVTELVDAKTRQVVYRWQGMSPRSVDWSEDNRYVSYSHGNNVFLLDRQNLSLKQVAEGLEGASGFDWYDNNTLIFNWNRSDESGHAFTKRYRAVQDRWAGWRDNSQIYLMDVQSGFVRQLTDDKLSSYLLSHDAKQGKLLFSRHPVDYKAPPHGISDLYEFDVKTQAAKKLLSDRNFGGAVYSSKGIYILGGPDFANGKGTNLSEGNPANNYDNQLYLMKKNGDIEALSKNFDPSISRFDVQANGDLTVQVADQDRTLLYRYSAKKKTFKKISSDLDVVSSFSISDEEVPTLVFAGSSATRPNKVYLQKRTRKEQLLVDTAASEYANTQFATIKEWDHKLANGDVIDGRYYLPPDFDKNKQYPLIVYYYGGTSSVKRGFTGRWPFSLYAAQGYVVYVVQPSGATGYGQDFSARHVNAWGKQTADDIMATTQAFIKEHKFIDEKRVGNMGASYGGFMTMYLATQTDMYSASISHAGISNLAEYWGFGWWGYGYSGVASKGSFPWNNRPLYVDQSPLFSADKITTPLLLLHGDSDTNVPHTESHQMYTALRLQDKDVEYVEFAGDDHHINSREHRLLWWDTILAYFDWKLKGQPLWWETLYPEP